MSLDKNKPHGEIYGAANGARYVQDGVHYDTEGQPIDPAPKAKKAAPAKKPDVVVGETTVEAPVIAQLSKQMVS